MQSAPLPEGARVAVAMSGGVDSSTTLALLVEQGVPVVGLTMRLWNYADERRVEGGCCTTEDISDAARVAARFGVPHYTIDYRGNFEREVVAPFLASYGAGETPNPCVLCNNHLKFAALLDRARQLGCDVLATGHYALVGERQDGTLGLFRGADARRDQSYYLFGAQGLLPHLRFPLGALTKPEVRAHAARLGVRTADKRDSQDICFIPDGKTSRFVERRLGGSRSGQVVDRSGRVLGRHQGVHRYTVGQRRGLGIAARHPLFVLDLDAEQNLVTVGPAEALAADRICVRDWRWFRRPREGEPTAVQIRSLSTPTPVARLSEGPNHRLTIHTGTPLRAPAPGQAAVIYGADGAREVLGGGWIVRESDSSRVNVD